MKIGITGASGFIAGELIPRLVELGHGCVAFSRSAPRNIAGCEETRAIGRDPHGIRLRALEADVRLSARGRRAECQNGQGEQ